MAAVKAQSVFINCPFTDDYYPMFRALVFAVVDCGCRPRCALELVDGGQNRLQKIEAIIEQSSFGVHDLSNMELDQQSGLPRFNMPFELGLYLGAIRFGGESQKQKRCLIMDSEQYRYQQAISDISGQDISCHNGSPADAIRCVRDWLSTHIHRPGLPGAGHIIDRYRRYEVDLPGICEALLYEEKHLTFNDLWETIVEWQKAAADA